MVLGICPSSRNYDAGAYVGLHITHTRPTTFHWPASVLCAIGMLSARYRVVQAAMGRNSVRGLGVFTVFIRGDDCKFSNEHPNEGSVQTNWRYKVYNQVSSCNYWIIFNQSRTLDKPCLSNEPNIFEPRAKHQDDFSIVCEETAPGRRRSRYGANRKCSWH